MTFLVRTFLTAPPKTLTQKSYQVRTASNLLAQPTMTQQHVCSKDRSRIFCREFFLRLLRLHRRRRHRLRRQGRSSETRSWGRSSPSWPPRSPSIPRLSVERKPLEIKLLSWFLACDGKPRLELGRVLGLVRQEGQLQGHKKLGNLANKRGICQW